jgi:nicotinamide/nicotinate riboside kinase
MSDGGDQAFIVAISGCGCSGKSTLAQLLWSIFPSSAVLHQDSFFKPNLQ